MTRGITIRRLLQASLLGVLVAAGATIAAEEQLGPKTGVPDGYKIIEGDIIVPEDFTFDSGGGLSTQATYLKTNWWPGGSVPYEFDANVTAGNKTAMIAAMAEWEAVAHINFYQRTTESDHLHIQDSDQNSSAVGRSGGEQTVNIYNWNYKFIMAHELGHALGFWHEQSRPDRDTYVTINTGSITDDMEYNFDKHADAGMYGTYDFDSVMHYGQCAFVSGCSCPASCAAITVKAPWHDTWQDALGQRDHFSTLDILGMQMLYPEPGDTFVDKNYTGGTQNGSFMAPYKTFTGGASHVPSWGRVIIQPATYTASAGVYTKAMTLRAPLGGVLLK